jgi:hypothetical protein
MIAVAGTVLVFVRRASQPKHRPADGPRIDKLNIGFSGCQHSGPERSVATEKAAEPCMYAIVSNPESRDARLPPRQTIQVTAMYGWWFGAAAMRPLAIPQSNKTSIDTG